MNALPPDQLSAALFQAFARGEASAAALSSALLAELASCCSTCRAALEAFVKASSPKVAGSNTVLEFKPRAVEGEIRDYSDLSALSWDERRARVRRSRSRYAGKSAAEAFLLKAREALPAFAADSRCWAELAQEALLGGAVTSQEEYLETAALEVRAWGFIANSERVAGNLATADDLFLKAAEVVRACGVRDLGVLAELHSFLGSLRRAQQRWAEAEAALRLAAELYSVVGNKQGCFAARLKRALVYNLAGDPDQMWEALQGLWPEAEAPRQRLEIRHNQVLALLECGEPQSAALLLDESLPLYREFPDSWTQSRLAYINGRVLHALDVRGPAEDNYRLARTEFLNLGEPYTAAVTSLDLAVLLLEDQRFTEVGELALDMLATFQKVGVHREALAAWQLFVDAAKRQEASVVLAKRLGRLLEQARQDPSLQFAAD
jgi:tetratricopeptide (TPR) repeat protein